MGSAKRVIARIQRFWPGVGRLIQVSCLLAGASCTSSSTSTPNGALDIVLQSDLSLPKDLDHLTLAVTQEGAPLLSVDQDLGAGALLLPATFDVKSTSNPAPVTVHAVGYKSGTARVERDAVTPIPSGHVGQLRLSLDYVCVGTAETDADGGVSSTCAAGQTCVEGACASDVVPPSQVPVVTPPSGALDASAGSDAGAASTTCFDVATCFGTASPADVDLSSCLVTLPAGTNPATVNVALQFPVGGPGVCGPTACWVSLTDWTLSGTRLQLAQGVCTDASAPGVSLVVSSACTTETPAMSPCGPWSSVTTVAPPPATMTTGPIGTTCTGPTTQSCGQCGTQTRACVDGAWTDWGDCTGEGPCAPGATMSCGAAGAQTCSDQCQWAPCTCPTGQMACGASGTCVSPSDVHTCGSCSTDCTMLANVTGPTSCNAGQCAFPSTSCAAGYGDCDGNAANGCETPLNDATHCGSCGNACTGTSTMCATGSTPACVSTCSGAVCGSSCTAPATDANNCGGCGKACPVPAHGQATCAGSSCGITCSAGYTSCGTTCSDTNSDGNNCGVCGNVCTSGSTCQGGKCTCSGAASQSCGNCGTQTRTCDENGTWSSWSACTGTVSNYGQSCGSCGGTIGCTGGCSVSTPSNYGQSCGSCGGTVACSGACSVSTPSNYGKACGSCGGTIACSGACSVSTPSNYGQSCTLSNKCLVNGTIACSGVCSGGTAVSVPSGEVCDPATGLFWQSPPPDAGMVNNFDLWADDAESDAASYCAGLGMSLPTATQLQDILGDGLDEYMEGWFWSSTPASSGDGVAIYFDLGAVSRSSVEDFPLTEPNYVRCVGN